MQDEQIKQNEQVNKSQDKLTDLMVDQWQQYSGFDSWQFWFLVIVLVLSLVFLYFFIDRKKALLIGFFGFNVHVWLDYYENIAVALNLWDYPYKVIPYLPAFAFDAALAPIAFMFVYQWTLNNKRNYYLYATVLSLILSFLWRPLISSIELFQVKDPVNYLYLFLGYIIVMIVSKWITNIFNHFQTEKKLT